MRRLQLNKLPIWVSLFAGIFALAVCNMWAPHGVAKTDGGSFEQPSPIEFTQQARLAVTPSSSFAGGSVTLSGDTAVVFSRNGYYVFVRSAGVWTQQALLVPSDGIGVLLGLAPTSVSLDGDTAVIGGGTATINGNSNRGAAYVFVRTGTSWTEQQRLTASDGMAGDTFGNSVAISGGSVIVGAYEARLNGVAHRGAAYVFTRSGSVWSQQTKLVAADSAGQYFGRIVSIDGDSAAVSQGSFTNATDPSAYIFVRNGTNWSQQQKISVCEPSGLGPYCEFGGSVSLDGDTLAVGNSLLTVGTHDGQGGVYVFTRTGTNWALQQRLTASDGQADDGFGTVALEHDMIVAGSPAGNVRPGAAYSFTRSNATWTQQQKFQEPSPNVSNILGYSVSISGNTFIAATPRDQGMPGPNAIGAVYVYAQPAASALRPPFDYDGDGRSDISVYRPSTGAWYLQRSQAGTYGVSFGASTDRIAPADYDGDGKTDIAVYRPSTGIWYITNSSSGSVRYELFGLAEDLPTPADYDGDGKADISVFRPSSGTWYRINSSDGSFTAAQFGADGDRPTVGDFDGDRKADIAIFRPSTGAWYQTYSSNGFLFGEQFGIATDKITPADFDGDGKTDIAIYRPSEGLWYVKNSATTTYVPYVFGLADDIPVAADFDGDGKADIGVFRPSDGTWYIVNSSNGEFTIYQFGAAGDQPTESAFDN